jgi:hypothetical protein
VSLRSALSALVLAAAGVLFAAGALHAQQQVRGIVRDGATGAPLPASWVLLLDGDRIVGHALTDSRGGYRLVAPGPGSYELRVDRIGYASTLSGTFDVNLGQNLERDIATKVEAIRLDGLDIRGAQRCQLRPGAGNATAIVWEEVRKALEAAEWTADMGMYRFAWSRFERSLSPDTRTVLSTEQGIRNAVGPRPFESVPPETLSRQGFMYEIDGALKYMAPDARVLLSDAFLDTHCFSLDSRLGASGESQTGLRFRPVDGRRLPEIEGVLWLSTQTKALRSLEYGYVNLPWKTTASFAGGTLAFRDLPNGTWIVHDWSIRVPRLREERNANNQVEQHVVLGYREEGGEVLRMTTEDGTLVEQTARFDVVIAEIERAAAEEAARIQGARVRAMADSTRAADSLKREVEIRGLPSVYRASSRLPSEMSEDEWLEATGFAKRGKGALIHQTRAEMQGQRTIRDVMRQSSRVEEILKNTGGVLEWQLKPSPDAPLPTSIPCTVGFFLNGSRLLSRSFLSADSAMAMLDTIPRLELDRMYSDQLTAFELYDNENAPVSEPSLCGIGMLWVGLLRGDDDAPFRGDIFGRVVRSDGRPIEGVAVTLQPGNVTLRSDAMGRFDFGNLAPASYTLLVGNVQLIGTHEATLKAGGRVEVRLEIGP